MANMYVIFKCGHEGSINLGITGKKLVQQQWIADNRANSELCPECQILEDARKIQEMEDTMEKREVFYGDFKIFMKK